jgi:uncharacterized protein DUF2628
MKTFRVFVHPVHGLEAVKSGFSWPAFLLPSVWMLEKRLWGRAALWFAMHTTVDLLAVTPGIEAALWCVLTAIGLRLFAGANANRWREQRLLKERYEPLKTIAADTSYEAVERAFGFTRRNADFTVHA